MWRSVWRLATADMFLICVCVCVCVCELSCACGRRPSRMFAIPMEHVVCLLVCACVCMGACVCRGACPMYAAAETKKPISVDGCMLYPCLHAHVCLHLNFRMLACVCSTASRMRPPAMPSSTSRNHRPSDIARCMVHMECCMMQDACMALPVHHLTR